MQSQNPEQGNSKHENSAIELLLKEAKNLHKSAKSETKLKSLPVLRRLISTNTLRDVSLPELHKRRDMVQRKHVLQMLALESGYPSWSDYRAALVGDPELSLGVYGLILPKAGYPNHWFSSLDQAQIFARDHGGRAIPVGGQAVVLQEND